MVSVSRFWLNLYEQALREFDEISSNIIRGFQHFYDSGAMKSLPAAPRQATFRCWELTLHSRAGKDRRGDARTLLRPQATWHMASRMRLSTGGNMAVPGYADGSTRPPNRFIGTSWSKYWPSTEFNSLR